LASSFFFKIVIALSSVLPDGPNSRALENLVYRPNHST